MFGHKHRDDTHVDDRHHDTHHEHAARDRHAHDTAAAPSGAAAHDEFGGVNAGAAFFGWLVAVALAVLLSSIIGAVAAGITSEANVTRSEAEVQAGTIGIVAAIVLTVVLALAYYTGGYVAGRMSRFDGGRQGFAVWVIGLLVTILAAVLGWAFGSEYNILERVNLPGLPVPTDQATWGGLITLAVILVVTALAAVAGGKMGRHYHDKVDAAYYH